MTDYTAANAALARRPRSTHRLVVGIPTRDLPEGNREKPAISYAQDRVRESIGTRAVGPVSAMVGYAGRIGSGCSVAWVEVDFDAESDEDATLVFRVVLAETGSISGAASRWDDHTTEGGLNYRSAKRIDEAPLAI